MISYMHQTLVSGECTRDAAVLGMLHPTEACVGCSHPGGISTFSLWCCP